MKFDAIICCYNESAAKVKITLEACLHQTLPFHKIYIIDDGSEEIPLEEAALPVSNIIHLIKLPQNKGISYARNTAIKLSKADYVACINIEIAIANDWLEKCYQSFLKHNDLGAVFGMLKTCKQNLLSSWRMRFHEIKYSATSDIADFAIGHAVLFKKIIIDQVGGYDESLKMVHEDAEICERIKATGKLIYYTANTFVISYQHDTLLNLSKKQLIRSTEGKYKQAGFFFCFKTTTYSLFNRLSRNLIKLRWQFLMIDFIIYLLGFYQYYKAKLTFKKKYK